MKKIFANKNLRYALFALGGLLFGWILFHSPSEPKEKQGITQTENKKTIWTCSMHPHIRMDHPGKCPICGMDLIPLNDHSTPVDSQAVQLTKDAAELANVATSIVSRQKPVKEVRLYGKIQPDERLLQSQVAHISGRIERLMVNYTGESVHKGQTIALVYSPELITAQQELLEAAKTKQSQPEIYQAARDKLRQWKFTDSQMTAVERSGRVKESIAIVANTSGIVTAKRVNNGDYVSQGGVLYDVANLSQVWVMFDAYESDLPFLNKGDKIDFTVQALPDNHFSGRITFIDPVIDPGTRVAKVRVEIPNPSGKLKPEMFATGTVSANLTRYQDKLVIPSSAVLWTGKRSIVFVKQTHTDQPAFKAREIEIGPRLGNSYIVVSGLNDGEEIVTQGTFNVDAAAQLDSKPSMMNQTDKQTTAAQPAHQMEHLSFHVSGACEQCKDRIEKAAKSVQGVTSAVWDMKTRKIHVNFDNNKTNVESIQKAIAKAGHDTEKFKADNKAYNSLPECCRYRK